VTATTATCRLRVRASISAGVKALHMAISYG
jgi:hypothetical protein